MVYFRERVDSHPDIMLGKPKIKGTRITVELILRKISDGYTFDEISCGHNLFQSKEGMNLLRSIEIK